MVKGIKFRRGTTSDHSTFTGQEGEITVDITKDVGVVHDGTTVGGHPLVGETAVQRITNKDINATALNVSGVATASYFVGDGSGLTGIIGAGSGVVVQNNGSTIGIAATINFGTNLIASFSSGIATITASGGGGSGDYALVAGIATYATRAGISTSVIGGIASVTQLSVSGVSTFAGITTVTGNTLFAKQVNVSGVSTFGNLNVNNSTTELSSIVNIRKAAGGNLTAGFDIGGGATLYYDGTQRLQTSSVGVVVNGDFVVQANGNISAGALILGSVSGATGNLSVSGVSTFAGITTVTGATLFAKQLNVSGISTLSSNVSVGGTISVNGGVTLATNNATIVGTSGTVGEIKRIGGAPFFYDGSAWREFVLSSGTPVSVPADTEWDNVVFRATFDTDFTDAKFGVSPVYVGGGSTIVGAAVTIGTGAFRNNGAVGSGVSYAYRSDYDFTGSWTIEFWMYVDSGPVNSSPVSPVSLVSMHSTTGIGTSGNWTLAMWEDQFANKYISWWNQGGIYSGGTTLYNTSNVTWNTSIIDKWNHFALVRQSNNGSLHFYVNGTEQGLTSANGIIDNDILDITGNGLHFGGGTTFRVGVTTFNSNATADVIIDDLRISAGVGTAGQRYNSIGITTYATFTPPSTQLPITGTLSSYVQPPGDKYGEIGLGTSPTWRGTSGVTVSQQSSGNYRVSFASSYTNSNDYFVLSQAMDQGFASYVGIARSITHVDLSINRQSNNAAVDTGSLAVQIKNHI